jgi:ligand-binding sensor domain-containing protein
MKVDHKVLAILAVFIGFLVVGAYQLGQSRNTPVPASESSEASTPAPASAPAGALPSGHPPLDQAAPQTVNQLPFTHFRVGNRNVKSLLLDGDVIWIGTSGGIIRYELATEEHTIYDNKVPGILSNGIFHLSKLDDRLVAGTYGGGMSVLDPQTGAWRNYNIPDGLADQFVYGVLRARDGDIWIATWSGVNRVRGGALDDPSAWETFTVENTDGGLPNLWVYGLREAADGSMWFGTEDGVAQYKDGKWRNWKHADGLGAPYEVVRDAITFTNDPGRYSDHHAQQKVEQGIENVNIAYNSNYVISLEIDGEGVVWAGTWGGGLARFDGTGWRNFTTADGLPANHIFMLHIDHKGRLWVGTSHGLARLNPDGETFTVMTAADGLFAENVFSLAVAADDTLWVGSYGGVARIVGLR